MANVKEEMLGSDLFEYPMTLIRRRVKVEFYNADEGWNGDFDPDDPEDVNLLRFSFAARVNGEWVSVADASYCTYVPAATDEETLKQLLVFLADRAASPIELAVKVLIDQHSGDEQAAFDSCQSDQLRVDGSRRLFEELSATAGTTLAA
jgi:hypothetical protein